MVSAAPDQTAWGEPLLTAEQLATALGFTRRQIYELVEEHGLPAYKIGRSLRFELSAVCGWLERRRVGEWDGRTLGGACERSPASARREYARPASVPTIEEEPHGVDP